MTKLISILVVLVVLFCAWQGFKYWEKVKNEEEQQAVSREMNPDSLPGLPYQLTESYNKAREKGTAAMRAWLQAYGNMVQDPRKAWIQLDFCVSIARENPAEARSVFREVKERTSPASPVWPRIKQLEKSYE